MRTLVLVFVFLVACGPAPAPAAPASPAPSASASSTSAAVAASAPSAAPEPPVSPGAVFISDIAGTPQFDPKPTIEGMRDEILACYRKARATTPGLRGKLTLHIAVNEAGKVNHVDGQGPANDPVLVECIGDALKSGPAFPRPGGSAVVTAPLIFHP